MRICSVPGCGRKHAAIGLCINHYQSQKPLNPFTKGGQCSKEIVRKLKRVLSRFPVEERQTMIGHWRAELTECEYEELMKVKDKIVENKLLVQ